MPESDGSQTFPPSRGRISDAYPSTPSQKAAYSSYPNSTNNDPQQQQQPHDTNGSNDYYSGLKQAPPPSSYPAYVSPAVARPSTNLSWGEAGRQPPLTSSKRDQNWEKKRRLWLARRGSSAPPSTAGYSRGGLATPVTAYGGNPWQHGGGDDAPASPLSKFVQQHASQQQFSRGNVFESAPPPNQTAYAPPTMYAAQHQHQLPPRTAYREDLMTLSYSAPPPPQTPQQYGQFARGATPGAGGYGYPAYQQQQQQPPPTQQSMYYGPSGAGGPPPTAAAAAAGGSGDWTNRGSTAASTASSASNRPRQPPGGNSNWSPFAGY